MKFPDFDFALATYGEKNFEEAYDHAECWFGVKNLGKFFDANTISVMIGYYGGGGVEAMEITGEFETEKSEFIEKIYSAVDNVIGRISSDDYVVFEIHEEVIE